MADPDLHLMAGGRRVEVMLRDDSFVFPLVLPCGEMRLMSRASRPSEVGGGADDRLLGFRVRTLTLVCDGRRHPVPLDHPALGDGLHAIEHTGMRWTDGAVALPEALFAGLHGPAELHVAGMALPLYQAGSAAVCDPRRSGGEGRNG